MPMSQIEMDRAITALQAANAAQVRINTDQSALIANLGQQNTTLEARLAAVEKTVGGGIVRLVDAVNQLGQFQSTLADRQTHVTQAAKPWRPV